MKIDLRRFSQWCLLLVLLMSGCASFQPQVRDPAEVTLSKEEGLVIGRLVTPRPSTSFNSQSVVLKVRSITMNRDYILTNKGEASAGGALFVGALPEGRYRLQEVVSKSRHQTLTAPLEGHELEFDVEVSRLSDFGAMVLTLEGALPGGGSKFRVDHLPSAKDTEAAFALLPEIVQAQLRKQPPLRTTQSSENAKAVRQFLRERAGIMSQSRVVDEGLVAFGRTLGLISFWEPSSGKWTHLDTGRVARIHSTYVEGSGPQLFGLEEGVVLAYDRGQLHTVNPAGKGTVIFLGRSPHGRYLAGVQERDSIVVLSSPSLKPAVWAELGRFPRVFELTSNNYTEAKLAIAGDRLVMVSWDPGDNEWLTTVHTLELDSGKWESIPLDLKSQFLPRMHVSDTGTITLYAGTARVRTISTSVDWGRTWANRPTDIAVSAFKSEKVMYGTGFGDGAKVTIWKSEDGGMHWEQTGVFPGILLSRSYTLPKPAWLLATTVEGRALVSSDDGASWSLLQF